nr:probable F-box protein At4g22165 [Lolium perenne]
MAGTSPELPQDILMVIFATLEIPDLVRAGSVCSSWHSAYRRLRKHYKRAQTPCLIYTSKSAGENVACLYSLAENRVYKLTLPEPPISTRYLIGSSLGLLVTVDNRSEMHLVNPITREQIDLPSVSTIEQVKPIYDYSGALHKYEYTCRTANMVYGRPSVFALAELRNNLHHKAFVFPDTCNRFLLVFIHNPFCQLSFARTGDDSWTWLPPYMHYHDCIYKDGLLCAATRLGEIHGFNLSSTVVTMKIIMEGPQPDRGPSVYIAQSPSGYLLQVWRSYEHYILEPKPGETVSWNTGQLEIFEVYGEGNKMKEISCLRDHVLFLGHNQTLCLTAEEYPALKGNHAYFTDDSVLWTRGFKSKRRDMGILNLGNKTREKIVSPQLWSKCPAPVWITPNFTKMNLAFTK